MSRADLAYPIAVGLAEGGWVTVLYLLVDAVARVDAPFGLPLFALVAGATCLLADRLDRLSASRLAIIVGLLIGGAVGGLLLAALASLAAGRLDPTGLLTGDPGSALLGLAALRGFIRAGAIREPTQATRPWFVGLVGLSCAWVFGGALSEPMRSTFQEAAVIPTLAFVIGALGSAGLARSALAASDAGIDPRLNRAWLVVLVGLTVALGLAALPTGVGLERLMAAFIAGPLALPLLIVTALIARIMVPSRKGVLRRTAAFTLGPLIVLVGLALISLLLPTRGSTPQPEQQGGVGGIVTEPTSPVFDLVLVGVTVAVVVGVLLFLARAWRRNVGPSGREGGVERHDHGLPRSEAEGAGGPGLGARLRRLTRRGRPGDAVSAYLAALRLLEPDVELRREPAETPAAHSHRLREAGAGTLELDLLAADFELARWAARRISPAEDRRAVRRWERLRGLRASPESRLGTGRAKGPGRPASPAEG